MNKDEILKIMKKDGIHFLEWEGEEFSLKDTIFIENREKDTSQMNQSFSVH